MAELAHIFIATHHKAGTVWMNSTFRRFGGYCGYPFVHLNSGEAAWGVREDKRAFMLSEMARLDSAGIARGVFVDYHSTTPDLSGVGRARGLHMVRDPRDMLISAVRYHETSDEAWLDQARGEYGGATFREKLMSYGSFDDRVRFELDTHMGDEIRRMRAFQDRADHGSVFRTVRYEDLIVDVDMTLFHGLCLHLGLAGMEIVHALRAFWACSIFGELKPAAASGSHRHIRDGGAAQWRRALGRSTIDLIQGEIGAEIEALGYPLG